MLKDFEIHNFTAFKKLEIALSPRINVIIGSNGTGKTHLLKAIYALAGAASLGADTSQSRDELEAGISEKLIRLFLPTDSKIGALHSGRSAGRTKLQVTNSDESRIAGAFHNNSEIARFEKGYRPDGKGTRPVFIPTKEVLSLVRGMRHPNHDRATVDMIFDDTYIDLAKQLVRSGFEDETPSIDEDPRLSNAVHALVDLIGGRYRWTDGGFCFEAGGYREKADPARSKSKTAQPYQDSTITRFVANGTDSFSSSMTAEGFRKVGILHRLLCNGSINPGVTGALLWDEPEANLNPKIMKKLVEILLELSRNGQQIILATHDYVLLKWFDLLMDKGKEDHVRFHVLLQEPDIGEVSIHSTDDYSMLVSTGIAKTFSELYDAEIERSLEGVTL
jgi:energy-coupling factor transporter ATP-binding protein EcfA2